MSAVRAIPSRMNGKDFTGTAMECPTCACRLSRVIESRSTEKWTRRRRVCANGHRFTTHEVVHSKNGSLDFPDMTKPRPKRGVTTIPEIHWENLGENGHEPKSVLSVFTDAALADELTKRGWRCLKDDGNGWETPSSFARRHGIHPGSLCRLLKRETIPGLELHRANGGKGRLVMVRGNQSTANWMECRKKVYA